MNQKNWKNIFYEGEEKLKLSEKDWSVTYNCSLPLRSTVSLVREGLLHQIQESEAHFPTLRPQSSHINATFVLYQPHFVVIFNNPCSLWALDRAILNWLSQGRKFTMDCISPRLQGFLLLLSSNPIFTEKKKVSQGWKDCSVHKVLDLQEEGSEFNPLNPCLKKLNVITWMFVIPEPKEAEIDKSWTYQPDSLAYLASSRTFRKPVSKKVDGFKQKSNYSHHKWGCYENLDESLSTQHWMRGSW